MNEDDYVKLPIALITAFAHRDDEALAALINGADATLTILTLCAFSTGLLRDLSERVRTPFPELLEMFGSAFAGLAE